MDKLKTYIRRQKELKDIMENSDAYASKCVKMGLVFETTYPELYAQYIAANEEYNANEKEMAPLLAERQRLIEERKQEAKRQGAILREQRKLQKK